MLTAADRVARFAIRERMFRHARSVLVAVSGGPDSLACVLILRELRQRFGFEVHAAHFDHQLRDGSHDDLEYVRELCARLEVPCYTGEGDVRSVARQQRTGIEDAARMMRYQFLGFVAAEKGIDAVATGHTADDQVETVLMRILRGTGVRGIRGMLPVSDVPGSAQRLLRPLLELTREDTRRVCEQAGIVPLEDPTNAEVDATRNRVRHITLPALRDVNPGVARALLGLAASAREAFGDIERKAMAVSPRERTPIGAVYDRAALAALPTEALTLVVAREAAFGKLDADVNRTRLENARRLLASGAGEVRFGAAVMQASCGLVRIGPPLEREPFEPRVLNVPGSTLAGRWRVDVLASEAPATPGSAKARVSFEHAAGALRVRPLWPGDRMRYHGIERKVADVFANAKVPAWARPGAVAIADREQVHAVFTPGAAFAADLAPDADPWFVRVTAVR